MTSTVRRWLIATAVAGALDLASAFVFAGMAGMGAAKVLRFVASGPFGDAALTGGPVYPLVGILVHFGLMACFAGAYVALADRLPALRASP